MPGREDRILDRFDQLLERAVKLLPRTTPLIDWSTCHAAAWRQGSDSGALHCLQRISAIQLDDLRCVDRQTQALEANTRQLLANLPANNALLWGPRGTGKSSLIKALLNKYAPDGLRMIDVPKAGIGELPQIFDLLDREAAHFIVLCDDLSFTEHDESYKTLKAVLEGSISGLPDNVAVYATSNRRHLLPERAADNLETQTIDGEIHHGDSIEEKISLSERFGLWLAFRPFSQDEYLHIVNHWLTRMDAPDTDSREVREAALRWALVHSTRSGRSAWHFAKDWIGKSGLRKIDAVKGT